MFLWKTGFTETPKNRISGPKQGRHEKIELEN